MTAASLALLFGVGAVAGILNVIAGGGSFVTLPVLILLGFPTAVANGTNRVALLLQNVGAVAVFGAAGVIDWRAGLVMGLGNLAGGQLGVRLTVLKGHAWVRGVVTATMVLFALRLWTMG